MTSPARRLSRRYLADAILLDHDPLTDVEVCDDPGAASLVVKAGAVMKATA